VKISKTVTNSGCVTITDEAFTIIFLENYWGCWFHQQLAQWTNSRCDNQQFMGCGVMKPTAVMMTPAS
jgi:hypothetical protein